MGRGQPRPRRAAASAADRRSRAGLTPGPRGRRAPTMEPRLPTQAWTARCRPVRSPVSPNAVEPGTRLVDRYRLEEHLGAADGTTYWRAQDELLDRPVGRVPPARHRGAGRAGRAGAAGRPPGGRPHRRAVPAGPGRQPRSTASSTSSASGSRATSLVDLLADGPLPPARGPRPRPGHRRCARRGSPGRPGPPVPAARARAAHQPRPGEGRRAGGRRRRTRHRAVQRRGRVPAGRGGHRPRSPTPR